MSFNLLDIEGIFAQIRRRLRLLELQGRSGVVRTGLAADRVDPSDLSSGVTTSFYATDTKTLSIWNIVTESWDEVTLT